MFGCCKRRPSLTWKRERGKEGQRDRGKEEQLMAVSLSLCLSVSLFLCLSVLFINVMREARGYFIASPSLASSAFACSDSWVLG
jgi:hypothetical protein